MKGLEFNEYTSLCDLLHGAFIKDYDWYVFEDEIIVNQEQLKIEGFISDFDLIKILSDPQSVIISMNLQAFPRGVIASKVLTYSDFLLSQCAFVVLVTDAVSVEIYTKNDDDFLLFIKNAERCNGKNITVKTENEDPRRLFRLT